MKINKWNKFIHIITHSYVPFLTYSALFMALIIFLMCAIEIDSYKVYKCTAGTDEECLLVKDFMPLTDADALYMYADKSSEILKLNIESTSRQDGITLIFPKEEIRSFMERNRADQYYLELPVKCSILKSLFSGL